VLSPLDSNRGKLLGQYVCARIVRMDDVNVGLFDRDWNNTTYYFILNADEQIYLRYGGRDSRSPDTYLNLSSLELALQNGIELHRRFLDGKLPGARRPAPLYPRDIPLLVERTFAHRACVECHLIGDFQNLAREQEGKLDKPADLYRSPDILTLGIQLDVPKGLVVKDARGSAAAGGMKPGDLIRDLNDTPVWTFADLQYRYDKVPRTARQIRIGIERDGVRRELTIELPERWWWTDVTFRQSSVEPRVYFDSRPLSPDEKSSLGLAADGFASEVTRVDSLAELLHSHQLRIGDIIRAVDGVQRDDLANTAELFIKLRRTAGDTVTLDVIRDHVEMRIKLTTYRLSFRK
jgi:hypothetical protein